jgi:hypothetical protein
MYKFINNPEQEKEMCLKILDDSKMRDYMRTSNAEQNLVIDEKRLLFCEVYSSHAREALNEQRVMFSAEASMLPLTSLKPAMKVSILWKISSRLPAGTSQVPRTTRMNTTV